MFQDLVSRIARRIFQRWPRLYLNGLIQRFYWDLVANDMNARWGQSKYDWDVIARMVARARASRILEVGCGSGRRFPLYLQLGAKQIVGQDISATAIRIAASRFRGTGIQLTQTPIPQLGMGDEHFDLAVSNRVLQHIPPEQIHCAVAALSRLSRFIYINELSNSDDPSLSTIIHKHDYERLFAEHNFKVSAKGMMIKQTWSLFAQSDAAEN